MSRQYQPIWGKEFFGALKDKGYILSQPDRGQTQITVLSANVEYGASIYGVIAAARELNAPVIFAHGHKQQDMTGLKIANVAEAVKKAATDLKFAQPYLLHADHLPIDIATAEEYISTDYTSFSIDGSHHYHPNAMTISDRIKCVVGVTKNLAEYLIKVCPKASLEAEIADDKSSITESGEAMLTTPDESCVMVTELQKLETPLDLLAIYNGYAHGTILGGEKTMNLDLTRAVANILLTLNPPVGLAQHGTTDTPEDILSGFPGAGIVKANVFTEYARIIYKNLPEGLQGKIDSAALSVHNDKIEELGEEGVVRKYFREFLCIAPEEELSGEVRAGIIKDTKEETLRLLRLFNCKGAADAFRG